MRRLSLALLVALAAAGCKKPEAPPAVPAMAPAAPAAQAAPAAPAGNQIQGKVLERLDAPPYSYLRLKTAQGEVWTAVEKTDLNPGAEVTVHGATMMRDFESRALNRKFDVVYLGSLSAGGGAAGGGAAAPGPAMMGMGTPEGQGGSATMADTHAAAAAGPSDAGDVKVDKASGADARTVSEVWAQRAQLKEKPVTVRAKVVKYNPGIMGKNWLHIRDGSGQSGKDNDLTVTTDDTAAVGDVVVVKGKVQVERDFGAGYKYPVLVEDAKLSKK